MRVNVDVVRPRAHRELRNRQLTGAQITSAVADRIKERSWRKTLDQFLSGSVQRQQEAKPMSRAVRDRKGWN